VATITDQLGSTAQAVTPSVNVTAMSPAGVLSLLQQALASLKASPTANRTVVLSSVLVAAEAAFLGNSSGALRDGVLDLLSAVAQSQASMDGSATASIVDVLLHLSTELTTRQAASVLSTIDTVTNSSTSIDQQTGSSVLEAVANALRGGSAGRVS
jgi:hypothetical protein